jgi:hypothetical protein
MHAWMILTKLYSLKRRGVLIRLKADQRLVKASGYKRGKNRTEILLEYLSAKVSP